MFIFKIMRFSLDMLIPLLMAVVLFLVYDDIKLSTIVFLLAVMGYEIVSTERYQSFMMWISPFVILAMMLFLTYVYLSGTWFWVSFILLVVITLVYGVMSIMLRSINIQ